MNIVTSNRLKGFWSAFHSNMINEMFCPNIPENMTLRRASLSNGEKCLCKGLEVSHENVNLKA